MKILKGWLSDRTVERAVKYLRDGPKRKVAV
jgi:hypothetical protein